MRMIPRTAYDTRSQAEKRIFDRLRAALDDSYTAYHSLKPARHPHKRFPEIDFVICSVEGLYVIEVKGGRVSLHDRVWRYKDRNGQVAESIEGPFRQAEAALRGLVEDVQANLPADVFDRFTIGYGVVFPDCDWRGKGAEWDDALVADLRRCHDMDGWLTSLFAHWRARRSVREKPDAEDVARLQDYLRPQVPETVAGRVSAHQVDDVRQRIDQLTEDQMRMVDVADANRRVLCAGGAGTGKTFLAERLARRWSDAGLQVALICRSPWLKHFLESRLTMLGITVSVINGVRLDCRRAGLRHFDAVIVDEGQDLLDMESLDVLDGVLDGGLTEGKWAWFEDLNQSLFPASDPRALERLLAPNPMRMPLRTNCRNTEVILEHVQKTLGADVGVKGAGAGPAVREQIAFDREQAGKLLGSEIFELVDQAGLAPGSVTILSPFDIKDSSVAAMSADCVRRVRRLDEFSMRARRRTTIGFAKIDEFKGLENDAVIVIDLPEPKRGHATAAHYVAMSRPRSVLSLIHRASSDASVSQGAKAIGTAKP